MTFRAAYRQPRGDAEVRPRPLFASQGASESQDGVPRGHAGRLYQRCCSRNGGRAGLNIGPNACACPDLQPEAAERQLADLAFTRPGWCRATCSRKLDPAHDYAITAVVTGNQLPFVSRGAQATFWGVPGDPAHDRVPLLPRPTKKVQANDAVARAPFERRGGPSVLHQPEGLRNRQRGGAYPASTPTWNRAELTPPVEYAQAVYDVKTATIPVFASSRKSHWRRATPRRRPDRPRSQTEGAAAQRRSRKREELYASNGFVKGNRHPADQEDGRHIARRT